MLQLIRRVLAPRGAPDEAARLSASTVIASVVGPAAEALWIANTERRPPIVAVLVARRADMRKLAAALQAAWLRSRSGSRELAFVVLREDEHKAIALLMREGEPLIGTPEHPPIRA